MPIGRTFQSQTRMSVPLFTASSELVGLLFLPDTLDPKEGKEKLRLGMFIQMEIQEHFQFTAVQVNALAFRIGAAVDANDLHVAFGHVAAAFRAFHPILFFPFHLPL